MDAAFWLARWEQQQIGFHQTEINSHLQAFWPQLGLEQGAQVFVPLCGKSRDLLWLRAQGHSVLGVEISHLAVAAFFEENGLTPEVSQQAPFERWECDGITILCGDFFALSAAMLEGCVAVFDRASLVALPAEMRSVYAAHLNALMPQGMETLLVALEYDQSLMDGPPFAVHPEEVEALYGERFAVETLYMIDTIDESPRFRQKGLQHLLERVYRLSPR
ncbi:thiopurine S-methyltransferase [Candidatus Endoriftia persephone]|jgi:thiopurine S-methyltransferase|uniref:Thiopurine S-methyltransferase n=3 Tax=Gammaproteobacteria TaxID=1236 RepID=G2FEE7_9GAMM|nr:thiopurine S-methyltransferase [Candidatus Endoriftia persephone]EGW54917.1 thiopurine S-methyltransferase [endosymbiont of Tevnia jerichonana (vent Tica)]USF89105.1 thiopurine S-methyltransferase [Candidatus Endoriftia persephone]